MNLIKIYAILLSVIFGFGRMQAQEAPYWTLVRDTAALQKQLRAEPHRNIKKYRSYILDINKLSNKIYTALDRGSTAAKSTNITGSFPTPSGTFKSYKIYATHTLSKTLAAKYPNIRSYLGIDTQNKANTIRFSITPYGLSATGFDIDQGLFVIDKVSKTQQYMVYAKKEASYSNSNFVCLSEKTRIGPLAQTGKKNISKKLNDSQLRVLRIAIAATGEYSSFHIQDAGLSASATTIQKKTAVLAAINNSLTRINGIFENEFALTMELVANNDEIIFLDEDTDGLTNNNANSLIDESQSTIDAIIGRENYDIGHTFSTGAGGLAQFNSPCTSRRAQGVTGLNVPKGDGFDINFVVHELGHQFGGQHVQNNDTQRSPTASVEPGSGSSIMGYAGISPPNVQSDSDDYFNSFNIIEMWDFISDLRSDSDCGIVLSTIANSPPQIGQLTSSHTIPHSTPFVLTVDASDPEGDQMTYCWEQQNATPAPMPPESTAVDGPLFRSLLPKTVPERYFPEIETVLAGNTQSEWEVVPTVPRNMDFSVTIRDNNPIGGQNIIAYVAMQTADTGPFVVTSQNDTGIIYDQNTIQTITWDVAGTDGNGINTATVDILLSYDGGMTFLETLIKGTANDGNEKIIIPNKQASKTCRIKIVPTGNVYYAMNTTNFEISNIVSVGNPAATGGLITTSPNPSVDGIFTVEFGQKLPDGRSVLLEVFDLSGKLIYANEVFNTFTTNVDISGATRGLYILRIVRGNEIVTKKIFFNKSQ